MGFDRMRRGGAAAAKVAGLGIAAVLATGVAVAPGQAWAGEQTDPEPVSAASEDQQATTSEAAAPQQQAGPAAGSSAPASAAPEAPAAGASDTTGAAQTAAAKGLAAQDDGGASVPAKSPAQTMQGTGGEGGADGVDQGSPQKTSAAQGPSAVPDVPATTPAAGDGVQAERQPAAAPSASTEAPGKAVAQVEEAPAPATKTASAAAPIQTSVTAEASLSATAAAGAPQPVADENVYRMYNPHSGEHFYTASLDEATHLFGVGWQWEAAAFKAASRSGNAVYRLYNPNAGNHFYTLSKAESDHLVKVGWRYESIAWYSVGTTALYRLYNPNSPIGEHLYTASADERDNVIREGWNYEGTAWNVVPGAFGISGRWVVSPAYGSLERYWIQRDTGLAKGRYVQPSEGTGYSVAAYATPGGAVARGAWYDGGSHVYLADNDGRLANRSSGWLETGDYDGGTPQRYYMDGLGRAKVGEFSVDGRNYLGRTDTGYVVRGTYFLGDTRYIADDSGAIQSKMSRKQIYVEWAKAIAADDSHGYSQINRWGPNYDCSALVVSALRQAGYATGAANSTRDMRRELTRYGWQVVAPNPNDLQYGDILLHDGVHTAIWCGNGQLVEAWEDENGSWQGYRSGDQTGQEIRVRSYYNDGWLCFLRHA